MRIHTQGKKLCVIAPFLLAVFVWAAAPTSQPGAVGSNTTLFLPAVAYDSGGSYPGSVAVADVNGDGKPDLTVANSYVCPYPSCLNGSVSVLLGRGDGTYQSAVAYDSGGTQTYAVVVADVNRDGKPDIVLVNYCFSSDVLGCLHGSVGVLLGNGDGTFQPAVTYNSGGYGPGSVAVADANGDGKPDLIAANYCDRLGCPGSLGVLLGNGDGTFQAVVAYRSGGNYAHSVAVADVNGDGKPDLLVGNHCVYPYNCDDLAGVLLGNGDGTFQPAVTYNSGDQYESSVAVEDVNGDGKPDLLTANFSSDTVGVLLNKGDGTFQTVATYELGGIYAFSVAVADVNDDGKPDLVVAHEYVLADHGSLGVLLGNGDGTFQPALEYNSGGEVPPLSVGIADLNGDGKPDLLVTNTCVSQTSCATGSVGVLMNSARSDTTPPVITVSATPKILWPPNGRAVPVTVAGTITDVGSRVNLGSATFGVSDEYGKVQPKGPIFLSPAGSYSFTVLLQASRPGTDMDGRSYTITVRAKDNAGNIGANATVVTVPHDLGQ